MLFGRMTGVGLDGLLLLFVCPFVSGCSRSGVGGGGAWQLAAAPFSQSNHEEIRTNKARRITSTDSTFPRSSAYRSGSQQPPRPPAPCDSVNRGQRSHEPPLDMNDHLARLRAWPGKPATQRFSFSVRDIWRSCWSPPSLGSLDQTRNRSA
jgi:hypothetical protein